MPAIIESGASVDTMAATARGDGTQPEKAAFRIGSVTYVLASAVDLLAQSRDGRLRLWGQNRRVDQARVDRLYEDQVRHLFAQRELTLFTPAPFVVHALPRGAAELLDGQHRLAVLRRLEETHPQSIADLWVVVCSIAGQTAEAVFERVNSGTPVPAAYYNQKVGAVVKAYLAEVTLRYPAAVSKAPHPHRPNINLARVCDEMTAHLPLRDAIIDGLVTPADLLGVTLEENSIERQVTAAGPRKGLPASAVERARRTNFYLGLREAWPVAVAIRVVALRAPAGPVAEAPDPAAEGQQ